MPRQFAWTLLLFTWLATPAAGAVTLRYGLVVGNDVGLDADGSQPFPRLRHAEREAARLRDRLVELANFDPSADRTLLLLGATRTEVREAVKRLVARQQADRQALGDPDVLFAFFFTGHGLSGKLLLEDGPLSARELGELFSAMGADFNIGVFDACYSGSLDQTELLKKGVELTRGLNIFEQLPEEVLTAEGSVWYTSSGPRQFSYEDEELGGVFMHFFTEALAEATADGPGITLDSIWDFARRRTVAYTSRYGHPQVPEQYVARLKATGPLYFSFPVERSAGLVLGESVEGRLVLSYADGQLTETMEKAAGTRLELRVYPGQAQLMVLRQGRPVVQEDLIFVDGGQVIIHGSSDPAPASRLGRVSQKLWIKGMGEQSLTATAELPAVSLFLGAGYSFELAPEGFAVPRHLARLSLRLDRGGLVGGLDLAYGYGDERYGSWSYRTDGMLGRVRAGYGWDLGPVRLALAGGLELGAQWQAYEDGAERTVWHLAPAFEVSYLWATASGVAVELAVSIAAAYLPGAGQQTGHYWQPQGGLGLTLYYRLR